MYNKKFFLFFFRVSLSFDRWLLSQGQTDRAVSILKTFARINKKQVDESVYKKLKVIDIFSQIFIFFSVVHHLLHLLSNSPHACVCVVEIKSQMFPFQKFNLHILFVSYTFYRVPPRRRWKRAPKSQRKRFSTC